METKMLNMQKKYLQYLGQLKEELKESNILTDSIEPLESVMYHTELLIPVIGAFSSGKSTLINSFLGNECLPVGITPETSLATELRYSEKEYIEAVNADNTVKEYAVDEMLKIKEKATDYKFIRLFLKNDKLKEIAPLVLVDMPGFDSPLDLHNKAIINYINKGVHYIILTSVEDGNLTRSVIRQLSDIRKYGRNFSFFLSKVNLKADSEVKEISQKIEEQLKEHFDLTGKIAQIGNDGGEALHKIIREIDPEKIFTNLFNEEIKNEFFSAVEAINISISALTKDKRENENAILEIKKGIDKIIRKRNQMLREAKEKHSEVSVNRIVACVGRELSGTVDELVGSALTGGQEALSNNLNGIVRHLLIENIRNTMGEISDGIIEDFALEIKDINSIMAGFSMDEKWLEKVTGVTKTIFDKANILLKDFGNQGKKQKGSDKLFKTITTVLAVTTDILAPILEVVLIFLPDILSSIFESFQKKKQADEVRNQILTNVIPSIKRELRSKLPDIFNEHVNKLITEIGSHFENVLETKQLVIAKQEEEKTNEINTIQEKIKTLNIVKDRITLLSNDLIFV